MPAEFDVRLAENPEELFAVQRLRYDVFVRELGASGPAVDHHLEIEADAFDAHSEHLMLLDRTRGADLTAQLVGVYRMMTQSGAASAGGFYTASEFDLTPLLQTGRPMMELGRSCLRKPYRGGGGDVLSLAGFGAACDPSGRGNSLWHSQFCRYRSPRAHSASVLAAAGASGAGQIAPHSDWSGRRASGRFWRV